MEDQKSILSEIENSEIEASNLQRVIANLVDFLFEIIIIVAVAFLFSRIFPGFLSANPYATYIIVFAIMFIYRFFCIVIFGRTIGMMGVRLKYLNASLQPLSGKEKLIAVAPIRTSIIKMYKQS